MDELSLKEGILDTFHWMFLTYRKAGHNRTVKNFTTDIQDSENYAILLRQIAPGSQ